MLGLRRCQVTHSLQNGQPEKQLGQRALQSKAFPFLPLIYRNQHLYTDNTAFTQQLATEYLPLCPHLQFSTKLIQQQALCSSLQWLEEPTHEGADSTTPRHSAIHKQLNAVLGVQKNSAAPSSSLESFSLICHSSGAAELVFFTKWTYQHVSGSC